MAKETEPILITIPVKFGEREFEVECDPDFWTCRREEEYYASADSFARKNIDLILNHVASWTAKDSKGNDIPLEREALLDTNMFLLKAVVIAMIAGVTPNEASSQA